MGKSVDSLIEFRNGGFRMGVKAVEKIGQFTRIAEIGFEDAVAVLIKNGAAGVFKDDVAERITTADLALDFAVQVIA